MPVTPAVVGGYIASKGIEILGAEAKKGLVQAAIATLPQSQTTRAFTEMIVEDIPLETHAFVKELHHMMSVLLERFDYSTTPEEERPTVADMMSALVDLGEATRKARGSRKRDILAAAFRASFAPDYFASGMAKHLWHIASQVEYPELRYLNTLLDQHDVGKRVELSVHDRGFFFAKCLSELGLVIYSEEAKTGHIGFPAYRHIAVLSEMAVIFRDFLLVGDYVFTSEGKAGL